VQSYDRLVAESEGTPDFEVIYGSSRLTPVMAARLWTVALSISDAFAEDMGEMWLDDLPNVAKRFADDEFVAAFAARFEVIADRLAAGLAELTDITTCTADEVALHMIIDRAEELEDEGSFGSALFSGLPRRDRDDDFFGLKDALLRDLDVLLLFDLSLDGVEDPTSEAYQLERFENLHPRDWFNTFERKT
jgi:hypothetical protein